MATKRKAPPEACRHCRFYVQNPVNGTCRRYPVSVPTDHGHWCGEFQRKAKA